MYKCLSGFTLIIGMLFGSLIHECAPNFSDTIVFLPCIILSFSFLAISAKDEYKASLSTPIVIALCLRFIIMLWNVYGRDIFCLPGVGTDTEGFFEAASSVGSNISLIKKDIYGSFYSKYLGLIFYMTGPSYLLGSYLNFVYSAISISYMYKILRQISGLDKKTLKFSMILFALEPNSMIIGSSLRRESLMILFVTLSIYSIIKWTDNSKFSSAAQALVFVLLASILHAGVIGLATGYVVLLLFYNPKLKCWKITTRNIAMALIIALGIVIVFFRYSSVFLSKLLFEDQDTLLRRASRAVGDAAYLTNLKINSMRDLILYSPLKIFYFLCSPVPWEWRGGADAIAFLMDATIYIYLSIKWIGQMSKAKNEPITFSLGVSCLVSIVIYSIGCSNAANSMRHRLKLLGIMIVIFSYLRASKNKNEKRHCYSKESLRNCEPKKL